MIFLQENGYTMIENIAIHWTSCKTPIHLKEVKRGKIVQNKFLCLAIAKDKIFFFARSLLEKLY